MNEETKKFPSIPEIFDIDGVLDKRKDGYEKREQQIQMASLVDGAIQHDENLIIEAKTGSGKSIAYLVPLIKAAIGQGKRSVVVTANINLQEQLVEKDLPFLAQIWEGLKFTLVKGRSNYLCLDALERYRITSQEQTWGARKTEFDVQCERINKWAEDTKTGDKSDLDFEPKSEAWRAFSVESAQACLGKKCEYRSRCFAQRARTQMDAMDIIVCNYHFLYSHLKVKQALGKNVLLPKFGILVCDEGHQATNIARSFFGWTVSIWAINRLRAAFDKAVQKAEKSKDKGIKSQVKGWKQLSQDLGAETDLYFDRLKNFYKEKSNNRFRKENQIDGKRLVAFLRNMALAFGDIYELYGDREDEMGKQERARLEKSMENANEHAAHISESMELSDKNCVYYVDVLGKNKSAQLVKRLVDISDMLWEQMFSQQVSIVTSATLAVDGCLDYSADTMGLKKRVDKVLSSPFDYKSQVMLFVSKGCPDPKEDRAGHPEKVAKSLKNIIERVEGRTLGLFTSYAGLNCAAEYLKGHVNGYKIMCQGDMPRKRLLDEFRENKSSVLLGTDSFWEGVDVPGESLSCVVIDKLPFANFQDPVLEARKELIEKAGGSWFFGFYLPEAVIKFKQGCGRLIRRKDDFGVIFVLDRRIKTKGYGKTFIKSLPPVGVTGKLDEIYGFLSRKAEEKVLL